MYVHLFAYPFKHLRLPGLAGKVEYAQFLHDGSELFFTDGEFNATAQSKEKEIDTNLTLYLPPVKPPCLVPVIELILK